MLEDQARSFELDQHADVAGPLVAVRQRVVADDSRAYDPADYTASLGGYPAMLAHHRGLAITAEQRRLFVTLLSQAADEVELPADPEFRAAIMGYAEWGSRLAVRNSDPVEDVVAEAPVPRWGWGVAPPFDY